MPDSTPSPTPLMQRMPGFYGWTVLAAATLGMAATLPGQTAGVSLFIDAFVDDLSLSRTVVSWLYTVATVTGSLALPWIGRKMDYIGPRRMVLLVGGGFALACMAMSQVRGWITLFLGFLMLRGLGQGALGLINNHVVNLWFEKRRGFAVGVLGLGMAGATAVFPPLIEQLLQAYGWATSYLIIGALLAVLVLPLLVAIYRPEPERFGLTPDADAHTKTGGASASNEASTVRGLTLPEARSTRTFWLFIAGGVCSGGLGTGLLFHHFAILAEAGADRALAAQFFVPYGILTAVFTLLMGALIDRTSPRYLLGVLMAAYAILMGGAPFASTPTLVWAYGFLFGVAQGTQNALLGSAFAYYFGRAHHGSVRGFAATIFVAGTALGPVLLALGPDFLSSFTPVLWASAPLAVVVGLAACWAEWRRWDAAALVHNP
ncbi:MAG: MFS transporter [Longimonas sp.]|uniref:MFS transporter n=1 Tax=Longimonas sp. TaxID=2039626 RepID=UPI003360DAA3